jgi:hypothetical protein
VDGNTPQTIFDTLRSRLREHVESNPQVSSVLQTLCTPTICKLGSMHAALLAAPACASNSNVQGSKRVHQRLSEMRLLLLQDFTGSCAVNCKDTPAPLKMALSIWWENSFNGACLSPRSRHRVSDLEETTACCLAQKDVRHA